MEDVGNDFFLFSSSLYFHLPTQIFPCRWNTFCQVAKIQAQLWLERESLRAAHGQIHNVHIGICRYGLGMLLKKVNEGVFIWSDNQKKETTTDF